VEHGAHRITRVREITLGGEEPRRTEALGERLQKAEATERDIAVLLESALRFFDPDSFLSSDAIGVDPLAIDLSVSPSGKRCYVGSSQFTQVVDRTRGSVATLRGVSVPRIALRMRANGPAADLEVWVHPQERRLRVVAFADDSRPELTQVTEVPGLPEIEHFLRVDGGDDVLILGEAKALDPIPWPGPVDCALERIGISSTGIERHAVAAHTRALDLLGFDGNGLLVMLEAPAKTHVKLWDPMSLQPRGSRAFPKNGMYTLATLAGPFSVIALRRWAKLDRIFVTEWGEAADRNEIRIADAKTAQEAYGPSAGKDA
jgi:hypothetical protein